jgi:hypothetical protein
MLRNLIFAGLLALLASAAFADAPDSLTTPPRQRPTATAPT